MNSVNNLTYSHYLSVQNDPNSPLLSYTDTIDNQAINAILAQVEGSSWFPVDIKTKIVVITVELLQNTLHHGPDKNNIKPSFCIEKSENRFILTASNPINIDKIHPIKKRIETLNAYTADELDNHYRDLLKNGLLTDEHAGLGLIEVIRKSGNPIFFKFAPIDNNYSLFTVKALV